MIASDFSSPPNSGSLPAEARVVTIVNNSVASEDLMHGTREVTIRHGEDVYRLRLTAQNKLILTK